MRSLNKLVKNMLIIRNCLPHKENWLPIRREEDNRTVKKKNQGEKLQKGYIICARILIS